LFFCLHRGGVFMASYSTQHRLIADRDVRNLVERLAQASQRGVGARLTPRSVNVALAALRALLAGGAPIKTKRSRAMFQIELMDRQGWPEAVIATTSDPLIAQAALVEARKQRPDSTIILRNGARRIAEAS
jgi:hypothetical protein